MPWQLSSQIPINPVHAAVGKTGKVLFFAGSGNDPSPAAYENSPEGARLWDPQSGDFTAPTIPRDRNGNPIDIFCAGHAFRHDGRLLVAGGTLQYDPFYGIIDVFLFDFTGNNGDGSWTRVSSMNRGRWYPTVLTLGNGRVLALSGLDINGNLDRNPEIYSAFTGWSIFTQQTSNLSLYVHLILLSSGKIFYTGAQVGVNNGVLPRILTLPATFDEAIAEQPVSGLEVPEYGNQAASLLLPPAQDQKVMIIGGGDIGVATNRVNIIDFKDSNPTYTTAPYLNYARMHHNAVILPDRTVFVCNGSGKEEDIGESTLPAEIYNPQTNTWTVVETPIVNGRVYHSIAVLLPDGKVVVAGGNPQRGVYENRIEIYSPAYISQPRPSIISAPATAKYRATIIIETDQPARNIKWVHLIKPMAPTHGLDTEQRLVDLPINSRSGNSLSVYVTKNRNLVVPGYYMLFIVDNNNVPSVASWIQIT
ncbi:DUF1929 domain-containing protein [Nostoc sp. FACHB-152]|uniref:galactose oxidase early set domain-containing protein n=1 Tax=unclassified Nostoc TaxID=2593658 RepID=UPI001681DD36|nr:MULTISPECIES: galactose oxidase early set domain-containing protein [unclassified Nostoc]MBD2450015.1 DUF1929 domain-containing protein [Nostoc sp. FACHB-152]MBD2470135.1 DUF1929 domain-containing protein [Nostoc sp. FACHB-145]